MSKFKFKARKRGSPCSPTNGQNANNGLKCVSQVQDYGKEDLTTHITDTLTNIRHLCDREGIDFEDALDSANLHWGAER
jgi:hypothetical protein